MTDMNNNENKGNDEQPKKKLVIRPTTPPIDLLTEKLGVLRVGHLSMKALIKISPDLDPMKEVNDRELVKTLLLAVTTHPTDSEEQPPTPLTPDEANQITKKDLHAFAKAFLDREKWELGTDGNGNPQDPEVALANKIRLQVAQIGESTKKMMDPFKGVFSEDTKRLFMMNTALSERLKEISGFASVNHLLKDLERFSAASILKNIPVSDLSKPNFAFPKEPIIPPILAPRLEEMPISKAAREMIELNKKADSIKETADTIAAAFGVINETVVSSMLDFKAKQQSDDKFQRISLTIAAGSLLASLLVGLISLYFSWHSYKSADGSNRSSSAQQIRSEKIAEKQIELLKELSLTQQQQGKLLSKINSTATTVKAKPPVKRVIPKSLRDLP